MVDAGVFYEGYASDMTRMFFYGNVPVKMKNIHSAVMDIYNDTFDMLEPGVTGKEVSEHVEKLLEKYGYAGRMPHSPGHGVGVEVHDHGVFSKTEVTVIERGMVITLEPGIYINGVGGSRYEDTIYISPRGAVKLTGSRE